MFYGKGPPLSAAITADAAHIGSFDFLTGQRLQADSKVKASSSSSTLELSLSFYADSTIIEQLSFFFFLLNPSCYGSTWKWVNREARCQNRCDVGEAAVVIQ